MAAQRGAARTRHGEEVRLLHRCLAVEAGQDVQGALFEPGAFGGGGRAWSRLPPSVQGMTSGGTLPHEERGAQVPFVLLQPERAGTGTSV